MPNSLIRLPTAEMVRRLATANAAISAEAESHVPRFPDRFEALASEPLTCEARSSAVVTVALGSTFWISALILAMAEALVALT